MSEHHAFHYIALIGDLVASRETAASDRRQIQARLTDHFAAIAMDARPGIAARPLVTLGDEFQALFRADPAGVIEVMELMPTVVELARPAVVRFGVGLGELTTELQPQALGIDGPCFHHARAALIRARDKDFLCQLATGAESPDQVWGALASYALRARSNWTEPQREAITLYEQLGAWNKVADALNVTRGAVSLRQRAAGWSAYRHAWTALEVELAQIVIERGGR